MTRCVRVCVCFTFSFVCFIVDVFVCNLVFVLTIHAKLLSSLFWMSTNNIIRKSTPKIPSWLQISFYDFGIAKTRGEVIVYKVLSFYSIMTVLYNLTYSLWLLCCCFLPQCFILLRQQKPTAFILFSFLFFSSTIDLYVRLLEIGDMRR